MSETEGAEGPSSGKFQIASGSSRSVPPLALDDMIRDINIDFPVDCENSPEPDDLDFHRIRGGRGETTTGRREADASKDVPDGAARRRVLMARFEQDGVSSSEAEQVVAFLADVKKQWDAWSSNDDIQKRAGAEWARIKKE